MKKLFGLVAVFFAFLIAVFAVIAFFPPTGLALRLVATGLRNHAGLDLKVAGAHSLRLFPEVNLKIDDITLATVDSSRAKPLATAKSLQVNASLWTALSGRFVDRIVLVDPDIDLDIGKDGLPVGVSLAPRRVTARAPSQPISVGTLEVTNARIAYRDQRDGTEARLERTRATLKDVQLDRFAEALVKAGAVTVKAPGEAGAFEITDLDATVSDFEMTRVREFAGTGAALKWRDAGGRATVEAEKFTTTARVITTKGADAVVFTAGDATWREPSGRSLRTSVMTANIGSLRAEGAGAADVKAGLASWREATGETYEAANLAAKAGTVRMEGIGSLDLKAGAVAWRDTSGRAIEAVDVAGTAKSVKPGRVDDLDVTSARAAWKDGKRSNSSAGLAVEQATFKTALLAAGTPIDGMAGFRWNGERVDAKLKLPPPETLGTAASLPATVAMTTSRGTLDFDGAIDTNSGTAKGKTRAVSASVEQLATWLRFGVPPTVRGPVNVTGDVDAQATRVALSNGRIEHGGNTVAGNLAVDMTNARPRLTGRLAADKLVVDNYLGYEASKPAPQATVAVQAGAKPRPLSVPRPIEVEPEVQLGDIFKSYVRSMIDAPVRNGAFDIQALPTENLAPRRSPSKPGFAWSTAPIDLSALRSVDLDVDWSVKQLSVRGMDLAVPQLKTTLDAGALTLQGRDVGTKEGRLSGEARIDTRQNVPAVTAKISGTGVDVLALTEALGLPPMLDGVSTLEADVRTAGNNQRQLVEQLSGRVKTEMPQGEVIGYDLGNISLSTLVGYFFGSRRFDPDRRTPISALKADLEIEKGLVRDSQVSLGGPFLGVNAEGTIKLVEQQLDYSGRARIASIFSGLRFKLFGDWTAPSLQPDILGFSRGGPGEPSLADIVAVADIKPDAEMALLVGRALAKATTSGADANTMALLQALQRKAVGN